MQFKFIENVFLKIFTVCFVIRQLKLSSTKNYNCIAFELCLLNFLAFNCNAHFKILMKSVCRDQTIPINIHTIPYEFLYC